MQALREAVLKGNADRYGQPANVHTTVSAADIVARTPWLKDIEATWGPAPGRHQTDGRGVHVLGARFGKVFVGLQPLFGYEGDPMQLLFEKGFAPTHAFTTFYRWLREDFAADAVLHFGMHGALEFMPGKQAGLSGDCWPDRLIGNLPNIYLYAANNPSEATLAKRRSNAITVTHLTPPLARAGLYKGLVDLKDTLTRLRGLAPDAVERGEMELLVREQAETLDLTGDTDALWLKLLETEGALITDGLHVLGKTPDAATLAELLSLLPEDAREDAARHLMADDEMQGLLRALSARFREWCNDEFSHGEAFALLMKTDPKLTTSFVNKLWIKFFLTAVYSTMWVRDHARPEFHKALGVDIEWYDQEVFRKTSTLSRQLFPIEVDIDHPRWIPNLKTLNRAFLAMDAAKRQGGAAGKLKGWAAGAKAALTFASLYTIPAKRHALPANVRLEPSY